jgi:hypothetical protein
MTFGPKRDEVTGEWRKLRNEEPRELYSSPSTIRIIKSRRMRWVGQVARMIANRHAYRVDNIRMDLRVVGWGDID